LTTKLKLLLDECVTAPLAKMLEESSGILTIKLVSQVMSGVDDVSVVRFATAEDRIVVTTETGINHRKFRICTHPGIIVLCGKHRHEAIQAETFKKFMLSGHRKKAVHAVIFLSQDQARVKTLDSEETIPLV